MCDFFVNSILIIKVNPPSLSLPGHHTTTLTHVVLFVDQGESGLASDTLSQWKSNSPCEGWDLRFPSGCEAQGLPRPNKPALIVLNLDPVSGPLLAQSLNTGFDTCFSSVRVQFGTEKRDPMERALMMPGGVQVVLGGKPDEMVG